MAMKLLEHAEHVGRAVGGALRAIGAVHEASPPVSRDDVLGDASGVEIAGRDRHARAGVQQPGQRVHRGEDAGGLRGRAELDCLAQQRYERPNRREPLDERCAPFAVGIGVRRRRELKQMRDRGTQFRPRHLALDRLPHRFQRQLLLMLERIQQHADGRRQLAGVLCQPRVAAQLHVAGLSRRPGEQVLSLIHISEPTRPY